MMQNRLREIKKIIYGLKRRYGLFITLFEPGTPVRDLEAGTETIAWTQYSVNKAILLPDNSQREAIYRAFALGQGKLGVFFDTKTRMLIIDGKDLSVEPTKDWVVQFENKRYEIKSVEEAEASSAFVLIIEHLTKYDAFSTELTVSQSLTFTPTAAGVIE